jgi:hypothetical protein
MRISGGRLANLPLLSPGPRVRPTMERLRDACMRFFGDRLLVETRDRLIHRVRIEDSLLTILEAPGLAAAPLDQGEADPDSG